MSYSFIDNFIFFFRVLRQYARRTFVSILAAIFSGVLLPLVGILLPKVLLRLIEVGGEQSRFLLAIGALGIAGLLFHTVNQYAHGVIQAEAGKVCQQFSYLLACKNLDIDYEYLGDPAVTGQYEEASRAIWDTGRFLNRAGETIVEWGTGIFGIAAYLVILIRLPLWLLLLILLAAVGSVLVSGMGEREKSRRSDKFAEGSRKADDLINASWNVKNGKDIRLFHMRPWLGSSMDSVLRLLKKESAQVSKKGFLSSCAAAVFAVILELSSYVFLTFQVLDGRMPASDYVLYIGAVLGVTTWLSYVFRSLKRLSLMKYDMSRIRSYLDIPDKNEERLRQSEEQYTAEKLLGKGCPCEITFSHVSYQYPGSDTCAVKDLSFTIKPGEKVALVGNNGSGKTTCVKLMCGLLQPTSGEVRLNQVPVSSLRHQECFSLFSVVFQDIHLFPFSVRENITWKAKGEEDGERLNSCILRSGFGECLKKLPRGLETNLVRQYGKDAVDLSGGEAQRLLIARALYKDAQIMLLDEPTSALDPLAEAEIYGMYRELTENKSVLFISHRLASVGFCDRILYIKDGTITESGSHARLMADGKDYAHDYHLQQQYYVEGGDAV